MGKRERYRDLVERRKSCDACSALTNASSIDGGMHDSDQIGPYSRWQGNLDAELMVVAQDFADVEGFRRHRGWAGENVQTNLTLVELIRQAGLRIEPPKYGQPDDQLFFTNAVLCMKRDGMGTRVPSACFERCGRRFLRPTIELVAPRVVLTLGAGAMRATCRAFEIKPPGTLGEAVAKRFQLNKTTALVPLFHPSRRVLSAARPLEAQREDWRRVGRMLGLHG